MKALASWRMCLDIHGPSLLNGATSTEVPCTGPYMYLLYFKKLVRKQVLRRLIVNNVLSEFLMHTRMPNFYQNVHLCSKANN